MTSTSKDDPLAFTVYMPYKAGASCYLFYMSRDDRVDDLRRAIRESLDLRDEVACQAIFLMKCDLPMGEPVQRYRVVMKLLRGYDVSKAMEPPCLLSNYFPSGPFPASDGRIDVLVVSKPILFSARQRPSTSVGIAPPNARITTHKSKEDMDRSVRTLLDSNSAKLREYLSGPPWSDFWEAPSYVDEQTRASVNGLKIPRVLGAPALLLHNLGNGIVDSDLVSGLFTTESKLLVNTSGSGKTRLIFEGLARHWGFYFTFFDNGTKHPLGSRDMESVATQISDSKGFVHDPDELPSEDQSRAYRFNDSIAIRCVCQDLTARVFVFEHFLNMAKEASRSKSINEFKQHWLFLQLQPERVLDSDIFKDVYMILRDAKDEFLMRDVLDVDRFLKALQRTFKLDKRFFFVLDEAQAALKILPKSFRWDERNVRRPVLRPIVKMWKRATNFPIVLSGTSISINIVNDSDNAAIMKGPKFILETRIGSFDTFEHQCRYMQHYMPARLSQTASGKELLHRAWIFARGRHGFTATLLTQLLKFSFRSPHRVFGAFVKAFCSFTPTDARQFVEEEPEFPNIDRNGTGVPKLDFSQIYKDGTRLAEVSSAVYTWLLNRQAKQPATSTGDLVELGFARFFNIGTAYIDEPLVLIAAAKEFGARGFSLDSHLKAPLTDGPSSDDFFEMFIAYYITCAFDEKTRLCDIFHFGESPPRFSQETAELVSVVFTEDGVDAHRFNWRNYEDPAANIGLNAKHSMKLTTKWLRNPSTLLCFPDDAMGPDIIFFLRVAGVILAVLVRCEWQARRTLDAWTLQSAKQSLDLQEIYENEYLTTESKETGKECAYEFFRRLKGKIFDLEAITHMEWNEWLPEGLPVLRVIASFPAETPDSLEEPHYAILNMERFQKLIGKEKLLERTAESLGIKLRAEDQDDIRCSQRSTKKQRMT